MNEPPGKSPERHAARWVKTSPGPHEPEIAVTDQIADFDAVRQIPMNLPRHLPDQPQVLIEMLHFPYKAHGVAMGSAPYRTNPHPKYTNINRTKSRRKSDNFVKDSLPLPTLLSCPNPEPMVNSGR